MTENRTPATPAPADLTPADVHPAHELAPDAAPCPPWCTVEWHPNSRLWEFAPGVNRNYTFGTRTCQTEPVLVPTRTLQGAPAVFAAAEPVTVWAERFQSFEIMAVTEGHPLAEVSPPAAKIAGPHAEDSFDADTLAGVIGALAKVRGILTAYPPGTSDGWQPTAEQPWRPVPDDDSGDRYLFDHGAPWCTDRAGHPEFNDGYPSLSHHRTECRSWGGLFAAMADDGTPGYLGAYLSRPFRFGQDRDDSNADETGLTVEWEPAEDDGQPFRCTVHPASARDLAAHLTHTADVQAGWRAPRHLSHTPTDD